jgi:hypothetical protein
VVADHRDHCGIDRQHPERVQELKSICLEPELAPLQGANLYYLIPVVSTAFRPSATVAQPFGLQLTTLR